MKASVLEQELALLQRIADRKHTIPILAHVAIEAGATGVRLRATDMDVWLCTHCEAEILAPGAVTVPASKLYELIKLVSGDVTIESKDGTAATVSAGSTVVKLVGYPLADYPSIVEPDADAQTVTVSSASLLMLIEQTAYAVDAKNLRGFTTTCAQLDFDEGQLHLVATDGSRLSSATAVATSAGGTLATPVLLPRRLLAELPSILKGQDEARLTVDENRVFLAAGGRVLIIRRIEGTFPAWKRIVPASRRSVATVEREALQQAIRRAKLVTPETSTHGVKLSIEPDRLVVSSAGNAVGEVTDPIAAVYRGSPAAFICSAPFMLDFLHGCRSAQVEIDFKSDVDVIVFRQMDESLTRHINAVMPLRP